jgi:putative tributyrin esterase
MRSIAAVGMLLGLGLVVPALCRAARLPSRGECLAVRSRILGRAVPYCVLLPPSYAAQTSRRYPVAYYLHGLGDNEQMFLNSGGWNRIEDLWERHELGEFLIVTPAGGRSFFINSRDGRERYEDFFLKEFIPFIETHYRIRRGRAFRAIGGISMGGYGALHIAFSHPELFVAVSVHSAALIEKLPSMPAADAPQPAPLGILGDAFGRPLDRTFWNRNNPITLARTVNLSGLKIYFDCGSEDDYGFNAGAEALHRVLLARHIPHEFHLYPGGHNWAYFAEHLPASLEFDSRAFGLSPRGPAANR